MRIFVFLIFLVTNLYGQNQTIEFCDDSLKTFTYLSIGTPNCTYHWSVYQDDRLIQTSNLDHVDVQYRKEGEYRIEAYIENTLCVSDTRIFNVLVIPCREPILLIPTAFTPNGDDLNDVLYVRGSYVEEVNIEIYNRWGNLLFQSNSFAKGWDGANSATDVYVCKVTYKDIRGIHGVQCSAITLYR
jgi:gliding motility-associated-like protein